MTARSHDVRLAAQHAEHGSNALQRLAKQCFVPVAADAVQDDAAEAHPLVEAREALDQGGHRARHRGGVDDEGHGCVQQSGDVRRRALVGLGAAVVQPHDALDDGDVRTPGAVQQ